MTEQHLSVEEDLNGPGWITEHCSEGGFAVSYKVEKCLHQEETPFQKIAVYQSSHFGKIMLLDGYIQITSKDNFVYHEMLSNLPLYTHPQPKDVCIIGGGDCGVLREILAQPCIQSVTQIDIDIRVTEVSQMHFPELCVRNEDPRATLLFQDGAAWIRACAPASLDVIVVDSTDPGEWGPGDVLYQEAFYAACRRALRAEGLVVQQSESPLIHQQIICTMRQRMLSAGFAWVHTFSFPQPCYATGWWSCTMAGTAGTDPFKFRYQDALRKAHPTHYYNADVHQASLAEPE
eukprot:CAMPEP_0173324866 /NCGR_PEP_ID=MMETSP1144-20121109/172_1 /TAXON_ID=483371 /ORGANISM="non described non described, Strain CCMP2298" /LENGTH=289 /DNA_ID=CAMNT_0014268961 /DNA_START=42 /DNA_END=908 /DNA_ORIENTATION=-